MENQHRQIKGYRELDQVDIDLMNEIKQKGVELRALHDRLNAHITANGEIEGAEQRRWLAIGRTHYQQSLMSLTRAVAAPNFE